MAAYATVDDVQARMSRTMTNDERETCATLLDDAGVMIDIYNEDASSDAKLIVSCRMVIRAMGDGDSVGFPMGTSQGSMSALGYSQSFTLPSGGGTGELYLSKLEKNMLGCGNKIGSRSPVEEFVGGAI